MEAEFLRWLKSRLNLQTSSLDGIGDDCATMTLDSQLTPVITADAIVDKVHFDSAIHSYHDIGWKALAVNLSDIASMAAESCYAVVSLICSDEMTFSDTCELYEGILSLAKQTGTTIIGGDFNRHTGSLMVSITAIGQARPEHLRFRFTTQSTDRIFVTGSLGGSIAGHHLTFMPRLQAGAELGKHPDVHAVTDITDGLVVDLHSILPAPLGATLFADAIPCRLSSDNAIQNALYDGEDFELLFTTTADVNLGSLTESLRGDIHEIGEVNSSGDITLMQHDQTTLQLPVSGYEH